ncbi:hypothetical protein MPTK1_4g11690 [Marchantia polymorpha subsp. ruderalis]|uniref:Protein yippee-like n=2 Tax=Marchantia polymorpha TaxID=3197 RepID=A0AAF6B8X3_MARPO|nr:hypothetical protein MARPO_0011s0154 [Marchantia polymorpha]BBN08455.1 hypothetical protein Mp_4g11690 [Marchantia polymorpha subsp. ruderalis]PTQ46492.1 hypothetical protein MARPO_0011s0154 [Marchantia polymorpha]PTQ46493.1 hypothetical protein MARPO_0011s0154 [Marchantia polymorpha]BBN08456.1 hypothetical protein Mp_4g11690 [Marchantia polymorpha subsp. ruderalis]|eukprot:PTQ46491.1 hypothetical protein MARPO_0011s0154 [Marchantia polymorpha]
MGKLYLIQLDGRIYSCKFCHSHLANSDQLVSRQFHCRHGKAYLFNTVVNVSVGPHEDRRMTTGLHTVADIFCNCCQQIVGWKYELAHELAQKYKEGKFILERAKVVDGDSNGSTDYYLDSQPVHSDTEDV